jgi:hypothetical protein
MTNKVCESAKQRVREGGGGVVKVPSTKFQVPEKLQIPNARTGECACPRGLRSEVLRYLLGILTNFGLVWTNFDPFDFFIFLGTDFNHQFTRMNTNWKRIIVSHGSRSRGTDCMNMGTMWKSSLPAREGIKPN